MAMLFIGLAGPTNIFCNWAQGILKAGKQPYVMGNEAFVFYDPQRDKYRMAKSTYMRTSAVHKGRCCH